MEEEHEFLEDCFQTFVLDMGSTNSRVELFPMQDDKNRMLHLQRFFPSLSMQRTIQQLVPVRWAAIPQDQKCKRPGDVLKGSPSL